DPRARPEYSGLVPEAAAADRGIREASVVGRDPAGHAENVDGEHDEHDRDGNGHHGGHQRDALAPRHRPTSSLASTRSLAASTRTRTSPKPRKSHGSPAAKLFSPGARTASSPLFGSGRSDWLPTNCSIRRRCSGL